MDRNKVRVIGGGWYGCHVASHLLDLGWDVTVFEKQARLFAGASAANQSRLHLGFHYPRCAATRRAAIEGFGRFMAAYGHLTSAVPINIYGVARDLSLIDFETFQRIIEAPFLTVDPVDYGLANMQGAMLTGERLIDCGMAAKHFEDALKGHVRLGEAARAGDGDGWAWTVNCTYGWQDTPGVEYLEPCVMFLFDGPADRAVTVMDGPHGVSLYPWWEGGISLTSVADTCLARCAGAAAVETVIDGLTDRRIDEIAAAMVGAIARYVPDFATSYRRTGHRISTRAKPASLADTRRVVVSRAGTVVSVLPGKISAVFEAAEKVENLMGRPVPA